MEHSLHKRNLSLDIARIIAAFAVVMTHCSALFVANYEPFTNEFIFGNIFDSISRIGVPLFLMISGALFLDERREITRKGMLCKNVRNMVITIIIWSTIYAVTYHIIFPLPSAENVNIKDLLHSIINGHSRMWYLYMIVGVYLATPFLRKFVYKENAKMVLSFIVISLVAQFLLPAVDRGLQRYFDVDFIGAWLGKLRLTFFDGYITYFLIGWYIVHVGIRKSLVKWMICGFGALSLVFMIVYVHFTGDTGGAYDNIGVPVLLYSVSTFFVLCNVRIKLRASAAQKVTNLSKLTFGVYMIHTIALSVFHRYFPYAKWPVLYIIVCFLTVGCSSFLISYVVSKTPVIKKIIKA